MASVSSLKISNVDYDIYAGSALKDSFGTIIDASAYAANSVFYVKGTLDEPNYSSASTYAVGAKVATGGYVYSASAAVTAAGAWSTNSGKFGKLSTVVWKGNTTATSAVTALTEGVKISYKIPAYGGSSNTQININGLGAKYVKRDTGNTTTHLPSGTIVNLTYDGTNWVWADYDSNSTYAGFVNAYCTAAAGTTAKVATATNYKMTTGNTILVYFSVANTATASNITLNVNSQGAKVIKLNGSAISNTNYNIPVGTWPCYYDGTNWNIWTDGTYQFSGVRANFYGNLTGSATSALTAGYAVSAGAAPVASHDHAYKLSGAGTALNISAGINLKPNGNIAITTAANTINISAKDTTYTSLNSINTAQYAALTAVSGVTGYFNNGSAKSADKATSATNAATANYAVSAGAAPSPLTAGTDLKITSNIVSVNTNGTADSANMAFVAGSGTSASLIGAFAIGARTSAIGVGANAVGWNTFASGEAAHAEGGGASAIAANSHAEGGGTLASSIYSHSEGLDTSASNIASHAEGYSTKALGEYSHAEGLSSFIASDSKAAHVGGSNNSIAGEPTITVGQGGIPSIIYGQVDDLTGWNTQPAKMPNALITYTNNLFPGYNDSESSGSNVYQFSTTSGSQVAFGIENTAIGRAAAVVGYSNAAISPYTFVAGKGNAAVDYGQSVVGVWSDPWASSPNISARFVVGVGSANDARKNGLVVADHGVWVNDRILSVNNNGLSIYGASSLAGGASIYIPASTASDIQFNNPVRFNNVNIGGSAYIGNSTLIGNELVIDFGSSANQDATVTSTQKAALVFTGKHGQDVSAALGFSYWNDPKRNGVSTANIGNCQGWFNFSVSDGGATGVGVLADVFSATNYLNVGKSYNSSYNASNAYSWTVGSITGKIGFYNIGVASDKTQWQITLPKQKSIICTMNFAVTATNGYCANTCVGFTTNTTWSGTASNTANLNFIANTTSILGGANSGCSPWNPTIMYSNTGTSDLNLRLRLGKLATASEGVIELKGINYIII